MTLTNPTDEQLDAAFAEKVAGLVLCGEGGWTHLIAGASMIKTGTCSHDNCCPEFPRFTKYFDAVLPWLEKWRDAGNYLHIGAHHVNGAGPGWGAELIDNSTNALHIMFDVSLPRAAVIALLRAHGVGVEFK